MNASTNWNLSRLTLAAAVVWAGVSWVIGWHLTTLIAGLWVGTSVWWVVESDRLRKMDRR